MRLLPAKAVFGAGCYWGTEKFFRYDLGRKALIGAKPILDGRVGFMGPPGAPANPLYNEVCSGTTNHVEVFEVDFDGEPKTYEDLVKFFFMFHDPTTAGRQEGDVGTQYESVIYCHGPEQMEIASRVRDELQTAIDQGRVTNYEEPKVVTEIREATVFYPAHEEHQQYLDKVPGGYCAHWLRFKTWPFPSSNEL